MRDARSLVDEAADRLASVGVGSPRVDAELLLAALLDVPRTSLITTRAVPDSVARSFDEHVGRRIAREPLQHITGSAPFRHIELAVGPGVFVPRPETELLVDAVLPRLRSLHRPAVVDLCAGSGALALAVANEVPGARVVAVERSFDASRWLARNAAGTDVRVVTGDVADPELLRALYDRADVVLANPPYVPTATQVQPEVLADPPQAVFAGADGLDVVPSVVARAALLLHVGGMLAMEHDESQGESVPALLARDGRWTDIADHDDLGGRARFVTATRA